MFKKLLTFAQERVVDLTTGVVAIPLMLRVTSKEVKVRPCLTKCSRCPRTFMPTTTHVGGLYGETIVTEICQRCLDLERFGPGWFESVPAKRAAAAEEFVEFKEKRKGRARR